MFQVSGKSLQGVCVPKLWKGHWEALWVMLRVCCPCVDGLVCFLPTSLAIVVALALVFVLVKFHSFHLSQLVLVFAFSLACTHVSYRMFTH